MKNFWMDLKRMLGAKDDMEHSNKMYSKYPLIDINSKLVKKRRRLLRSHFVLMDLAITPGLGDSGLFVIYERSKTFASTSKRTVFILAVIVAFILGLLFGVFLKVNVEETPFSKSNSKETRLKNDSFHSVSKITIERETGNSFITGIFWSDLVEEALPPGFTEDDGSQWDEYVRRTPIVKLEEGCGRMQNRLATFRDGTRACCRYRQNTDQIQGEMFSYYLGRRLELRNMVPSTVIAVNTSAVTWREVVSQLATSRWSEDHPVVFTRYIRDLVPANIPQAFRHLTSNALPSELNIKEWIKSGEDAVELAQWSDLVVLDYLTGNLDRVVNNLYNLQWNPDMLSSPAHNLARTASSELLVFLDNESGMLHGYRLLDKYEPYHSLLLSSVCVFRKATVHALASLSLHSNPGTLLSQDLPSLDLLPPLPDSNGNTLRLRVARVLRQVLSCAEKHLS